jgi:hypothetical protein
MGGKVMGNDTGAIHPTPSIGRCEEVRNVEACWKKEVIERHFPV